MSAARRARLTIAGLLVGTAPVMALQPQGSPGMPLPQPRPELSYSNSIDRTATGSVPFFAAGMIDPQNGAGASLAQLKAGLDALALGDVAVAQATRDALPAGALDRQILVWAIAMSGADGVSSGEIAEAARTLAGWPGMAALRRNSEKAMFRENPDPTTVVQAFGGSRPQTVEGLTVLLRAQLALGDHKAAAATLAPFWRKEKLDARDEIAILKEFGPLIARSDHRQRMERMLYDERLASGGRVAGPAGAHALATAWSAVLRGDKAAQKLLDAVPKAERGAAFLFAQARQLRRQERFQDAAAIMLQAPRDAASLVDPDAWWVERRILSRELLDKGDAQTAYRLAAAHSAESPAMAAEAEFHAGWYALRALDDPAEATPHFRRIAEIADGPISLARAYYWLGRSAEAGGPGSAPSYYEKAAAYGATFYGQLAANRIGRTTLDIAYPTPTEADRRNFDSRRAVAAIRRLEEAGFPQRADMLYRELAAELNSPGELALLAVMAERRGNHYLSLRVGKIAASRGIDIGALAHPIGVIPASADISSAGKALAYAIARQESEFNVGAVSGAGARGLLQLLPGTAKDMARKAGLAYSAAKLTSDAGYNATLGAAYLGEQLESFAGSYILTFAGYNAGPRRARDWVAKYGDPRGKDIDTVVDWIERIPFSETRNYVQRVMENYQVYKLRLTGQFDIVRDLESGR